VVSKPNQGSDVKIVVCTSPDQPDESPDLQYSTTSIPRGKDIVSSQSHVVLDTGGSILAQVSGPSLRDVDLRNCITSSNPRRSKKPIANDAMTFTGPRPTIFESRGALVDVRDPLSYALKCW
jgi:hypothetical protein